MIAPILLVTVGSLGLAPAATYYAALRPSDRPALFGTLQVLAILQAAILVPVGYLVLPLVLRRFDESVLTTGQWFLWTIPLGLSTLYSVAVLTGAYKINSVNLLNAIMPVGYLSATLFLAGMHALTVKNIALFQILMNLVVTIVAAVCIIRMRLGHLRAERRFARTLFSYGSKSHLGSLGQTLNLRFDQAILAGFLSARDVGLYVVAVNSISPLQAVSQAGRAVFVARVVEIVKTGRDRRSIAAMYRQFAVALGAASILLGLALPLAIPAIFGNTFRDSVPSAYLLLVAGVGYSLKDVLSAILQGLEDPWQSSRAELIGLLVTVTGLAVCVPAFGILGAALVSLLSYFTSLLVQLRALSRRHSIRPSEMLILRRADIDRAARPIFSRLSTMWR